MNDWTSGGLNKAVLVTSYRETDHPRTHIILQGHQTGAEWSRERVTLVKKKQFARGKEWGIPQFVRQQMDKEWVAQIHHCSHRDLPLLDYQSRRVLGSLLMQDHLVLSEASWHTHIHTHTHIETKVDPGYATLINAIKHWLVLCTMCTRLFTWEM